MSSLVQLFAPNDFVFPLKDLGGYPAAYEQLQNEDFILAMQDLESSGCNNWSFTHGLNDEPDSNCGLILANGSDTGLTSNSSISALNEKQIAHTVLSEQSRITRCNQCRLSNARCDQKCPCSRCIKFQIDCVYSEKTLHELQQQRNMARASEEALSISQAPPLKKRTRVAAPSAKCEECRVSHFICDQKKPCSRCVKCEIDCVYSKKTLSELELLRKRDKAAGETPALTQAPALSKKKRPRVVRCDSCKLHDATCEEKNPCSRCIKYETKCVYTKTTLRGLQAQNKRAKAIEEAPAISFVPTVTKERIKRVIPPDKHCSSYCDPCRLSSATCDEKNPCSRCKSYLIECVYSKKRLRELRLERKIAKAAEKASALPKKPIKRVVPAAKHCSSYCDPCRLKGVTCDQNNPCSRCRNYLIECVYSKKSMNELRFERERAKAAVETPSNAAVSPNANPPLLVSSETKRDSDKLAYEKIA